MRRMMLRPTAFSGGSWGSCVGCPWASGGLAGARAVGDCPKSHLSPAVWGQESALPLPALGCRERLEGERKGPRGESDLGPATPRP